MKVIIPLAGKGTRLRPHTHLTPKPLLQVAGQPVMSYILDELKNFDIEEVIFITGHLKEQVETYVRAKYPEFKSRFIEQEVQNGTATAVQLAEPYVKEDVLIIYVDTLFDADLSVIKNLLMDVDGAIWVKEVEDYRRFGVAVTDERGLIKKFVEKPKEPVSKLAAIGVYYVKEAKVLFAAIEKLINKNHKPLGEFYLTDAFQYMIDNGAKIKTIAVEGWYDCGQIETLIATNKHLLSTGRAKKPAQKPGVVIHEPVYIADGVILENVELGPNVTVSHGSTIKSSVIKDSIIGERTTVESAKLHNSLIGNDAIIQGIEGSLSVTDHSEIVGKPNGS